MKNFEATLLITPNITKNSLEKVGEIFEKLVVNEGGSIKGKEDCGLRDLAYKIKNLKKAFYLFYQIEIYGDTKCCNHTKNVLDLDLDKNKNLGFISWETFEKGQKFKNTCMDIAEEEGDLLSVNNYNKKLTTIDLQRREAGLPDNYQLEILKMLNMFKKKWGL